MSSERQLVTACDVRRAAWEGEGNGGERESQNTRNDEYASTRHGGRKGQVGFQCKGLFEIGANENWMRQSKIGKRGDDA